LGFWSVCRPGNGVCRATCFFGWVFGRTAFWFGFDGGGMGIFSLFLWLFVRFAVSDGSEYDLF
jgi:uncharacterized membrane protein